MTSESRFTEPTEGKRTVQLTGSWPIEIECEEWPIRSEGIYEAHKGGKLTLVVVRERAQEKSAHEVGQRDSEWLVYGIALDPIDRGQQGQAKPEVPRIEHGRLMRAKAGDGALVAQIARVAKDLGCEEAGRLCIRNLPPVQPRA